MKYSLLQSMLQPSYGNKKLLKANTKNTHFSDVGIIFDFDQEKERKLRKVFVSMVCTAHVANKSYY